MNSFLDAVNRRKRTAAHKRTALRFEQLESRRMLAAIVWSKSVGGSWSDPNNWDLHRVPALTDDVVIPDLAGNQTIAITGGTNSANKINSAETLSLQKGTLQVAATLDSAAGITLAGGTLRGGTLLGSTVATVDSNGSTLDGVTVNGELDLSQKKVDLKISNGFTLNGTAKVGNSAGTVNATLTFLATQTLGGTGTVTFGGSSGNALIVSGGGSSTLTIGSDITIQGGSGSVRDSGAYRNLETFINQGTIHINAGSTLGLRGTNWRNEGSIHAAGATVDLQGSFDTASLGSFDALGGTVNLSGAMNNAATTFTMKNAIGGSWRLTGGSITGGTITQQDNAALLLTNGGGTLSGVTIASGMVIDGKGKNAGYPQNSNSLTITNGITNNGDIRLGAVDDSTNATLTAFGTQTLGGTGTVTFGGSSGNALIVSGGGSSTLTIGSDITIQGGSGSVRDSGAYRNLETFINQGTIHINAGSTLGLRGTNWRNEGSIHAAGATVDLQGSFDTASLGSFDALGGTVNLSGAMNNAATTFTMKNAIGGSWRLTGGSITGGTITQQDNAALLLTNGGGTLSGVTIASGMVIDGKGKNAGYPQNSNSLTITNGITNNGDIRLGAVDDSTNATLTAFGTQTLGGTGTVTFGGSAGNALIAGGGGTSGLTIGSGITIQGGSGTLRGTGNYGTLETVKNHGIVNVANGGDITVADSQIVGNATTFIEQPGGTIQFQGNLTGSTQSPTSLSLTGTTVFSGGSSGVPLQFEVMSRDLGNESAGFTSSNFAFGSVTLASKTFLQLVDQSDNSPEALPEALYVDSLVIPATSTLDLNGFHVYTRSLQQVGTIVNGTVNVIVGSTPLTLGLPTPGEIKSAGEMDKWNFTGQAGHSATVQINPGSSGNPPVIAPHLNWVRIQLIAPNGNVLADVSNTVAGAKALLDNILLPTNGVYEVHVNASSAHATSTGNYVITAWDTTTKNHSLASNQSITGGITIPFAADRWTFTASINQWLRFDLVSLSAPGLTFILTGPNNFSATLDITDDSPLIIIPADGTYSVHVNSDAGAIGTYAFVLWQTSVTGLTVGTPFQGTLLGSGQPLLFRVDVPTSQVLKVAITDAATVGHTELYASFAAPPSRTDFEHSSSELNRNPELKILSAKSGAWYFLVYADNVPQKGPFTLTASLTKITPDVTWSHPADITFGAQLTAAQLNATSSTPGTLVYTPALGTILDAGATQTLSVTFTPTDVVNNEVVTSTVNINVAKATPVVAWSHPADITFGTQLTAAQLNATSSTPGTFVYTPALGTILDAGATQTLSVTFTPADVVNNEVVTSTVNINVAKATPVVTWSDPTPVFAGLPLSTDELNATATVPGSFAYAPAIGTVLSAGYNQLLSTTFTPTDTANYKIITTTVTIDVLNQNDPVVIWPTPVEIFFGTPLSAAQLNATSPTPGTFTYTPALGTVLDAGSSQTLSVTFTPNDTTQFSTVTQTTTINVLASLMDFGDAPSRMQSGFASDYPVTENQDGATHVVGSLFLGTAIDAEADGTASENAEGDIDDDGIGFLVDPVAAADTVTTASVRVRSSGTGIVDAWFDFNRDGDWSDTGERIISGAAVESGDTMLSYQVPAGATPGSSYARFRLSTLGSELPTGAAADGEVEDYRVDLLDGDAAPTVTIRSVTSDNVLHLRSDLVTLLSGTLTQFEAPADQVGSIDYQPLSTSESINLVLAADYAVAANHIQFRVFADGSSINVSGTGGSIDLTNTATQAATGRVSLDLTHENVNSATINAALAQRWSADSLPMQVMIGSSDRLLFTDAADWRITEPVMSESTYQLTAATLRRDAAIIVTAAQPWQNFIRFNDVDNNGLVLASDALRIINELNSPKYSGSDGQLTDPAALAENPNSYYDTSGDGFVTPLDALRVINELNLQPLGAEPIEIARQGAQAAFAAAPVVEAQRDPASHDESMSTLNEFNVTSRSKNLVAFNPDLVMGQRLSADLPSNPTAVDSLADEHERTVDELFATEAFANIRVL